MFDYHKAINHDRCIHGNNIAISYYLLCAIKDLTEKKFCRFCQIVKVLQYSAHGRSLAVI